MVNTGHFDHSMNLFESTHLIRALADSRSFPVTEEQTKSATAMMGKFAEYAPNFTGPSTPEDSVKDVMSVINKASVQDGDGGSFVSHFGNKQWL